MVPMNRRALLRNSLLLASASVVAPEILAEALPTETAATLDFQPLRISDMINVDVTIYPLCPTYDHILANLTEQWFNMYGEIAGPEAEDWMMLSLMAETLHEMQEKCRGLVEVGSVGSWVART